MKLASISPDFVARCLACAWSYKAPLKKRRGGALTVEDRVKILEENILCHLRICHDRCLLTKEELEPHEEGALGRVYYSGRRVVRSR